MSKLKFKILVLLLCTPSIVWAADTLLAETPTSWRLQNYVLDTLVVYFTSSLAQSNCVVGSLVMPSGSSAGDRSRFWATVMAGKLSGKKVFVVYESTTCTIKSFGLLEE